LHINPAQSKIHRQPSQRKTQIVKGKIMLTSKLWVCTSRVLFILLYRFKVGWIWMPCSIPGFKKGFCKTVPNISHCFYGEGLPYISILFRGTDKEGLLFVRGLYYYYCVVKCQPSHKQGIRLMQGQLQRLLRLFFVDFKPTHHIPFHFLQLVDLKICFICPWTHATHHWFSIKLWCAKYSVNSTLNAWQILHSCMHFFIIQQSVEIY